MSEYRSPTHAGNGADAMRFTPPPPGTRTAEQIRSDIVDQREDLGRSVEMLRTRWSQVTDVSRQVRKHRSKLIIGAAAVGFLVGGAIALSRRPG